MAIKILLADDSLTIQKVVELTFSDAETRLMAVGSGDRAVQALDDFQPDIVLADVVMPGLTGYDVCDAVKQRPGGVFIPVVLLTGTFEPFDRARAERVGSDAIVTKPFDSHALQGLVRDLVAKARTVREEAEAAAAAAASAPPAPPAIPVPPPVPEPPATMILSVEDLEAEVPTRAPYVEDTGATQAMPALVLPESSSPPFEAEEPVLKVEESNFRTMAMKIPTAEELAAAAPKEIGEPAPAYTSPPPPPPPAFYEAESASLVPPPPSPFYRPDAAFAVPLPPPAFDEPEIAAVLPPPSPFDMSPANEVEPPAPAVFEPEFVPPVPPPPPAFYEPEPVFVPPPPPPPPAFHEEDPALLVPPIPPLPPAFDAPEATSLAAPAAPFEPELEQTPEPFIVEMGSLAPGSQEAVPLAPFETVPEPGAVSGPEEIEVALYDLAEEPPTAEGAVTPATPVAEKPAFDLLIEESAAPVAETLLAAEAEVVEEGSVEPFPEMDEPVPGVEAEAAPWDEGPAVEIPPPPPELSGGPDDSEGTEPITRDIEADLEAFEASGRVTRRPEIWERHAALIGEEAPADIDRHGSLPEELQPPAMEDPSSSELEAMAAAARIEDLSALIPSGPAPVAETAASIPPPSEEKTEAAVTTAPLGSAAVPALSDGDVERIARRVVQLLSDKAVRDIAWEVVPEYAERLVRERIAEVERAG